MYGANIITCTTAYLTVTLAQANVYGVSNITPRVRCPVARRPQPLSMPQLHRPGKVRTVATHSGM